MLVITVLDVYSSMLYFSLIYWMYILVCDVFISKLVVYCSVLLLLCLACLCGYILKCAMVVITMLDVYFSFQ